MGVDASTANTIQSPADIPIPTSLRPIHPFIEDAQRNLCNARKADDPSVVQKRKKVAVACINHGFKVRWGPGLACPPGVYPPGTVVLTDTIPPFSPSTLPLPYRRS